MIDRSAVMRLRRRRLAVLKGGWSRERPISLRTGAAVEAALRRLRLPFVSIDADRDVLTRLMRQRIQFAFICLHGTFGEDGQIQALLESAGIGYTGSGPLASAAAMNKPLAKALFSARGLPVAPGFVVSAERWRADETAVGADVRRFLRGGPVIVKPTDQGSAIGVTPVMKKTQLRAALRACFRVSREALVERYRPGRELTVGIIGRRALPVVEIVPEHAFYDYHSKYAKGGSRHLVPAPLPAALARGIRETALAAFQALGCEIYGRVDFMMPKSGRFFLLEANTIPGMTETSLLPDAAKAAGMSFDELVLRIAALSVARDRAR